MKGDRLQLALPFDVLRDGRKVHLVAGEDFRVSLGGLADSEWVCRVIERLASPTARSALYPLAPDAETLDTLLDQLLGERVLVLASPAPEAAPEDVSLAVTGSGQLHQALSRVIESRTEEPTIELCCQDTLDYDEALKTNARVLAAGGRWLWATTGPRARAFVSPVFLPEAGPCLECIVGGFRRLSEAPELYDALIAHRQAGGELEPAQLSEPQLGLVVNLVKTKLDAYFRRESSAFRLHILELSQLEITSVAVWPDPECGGCARR